MLGGAQSEPPAQQEALKRNTDCVYFLASPLTCKKGSECEYRHSDIARLNPRDCWYWLNGNCLNPKCAFRHPPLDGLLEVTTPAVNSVPPSQTVVPVAAQGPNVPSKQAVPCIFFQQGYCMKGDMCPFMHSPYSLSLNHKAAQSAGATPVSESQVNKKTFGGLGKHTQEQKVLQANAPKFTDFPPQMKSSSVLGKAPLRNEISVSGNKPIAPGLDGEFTRYSRGNVHSSSNGNLVSSRLNRSSQVHTVHDQSDLNVKDADEVSREPSPGFDVLVDDEIRDSEYYPDEDQFGSTGHDGMNFTAANVYDIGRSADYGSVGGVDRDMYRDSRSYDSLERLHGQYDPSERNVRGSANLERRRYPRADSPGQIDGSDLRYHLSKQKRNNGLRSVISRDPSRDNYADDRRPRASRRDQLPVYDASSRLRGRIKIPGRSMSPNNRINPGSERETDRSRHLRRLSPERPLGRLRDRIKGSVQEDFDNGKNLRGSSTRRDLIYDNNSEFSGPKSLSELKVRKTSESSEKQMSDSLLRGKRKYPQTEEVNLGEGDASFEGPKPLSEILKRKRGGVVAFHESGSTNDRDYKEGKGSMKIPPDAKDFKFSFSSEANNQVNQSRLNGELIPAVGVAEENSKLNEGQSSLQKNASELQIEEGMIGDEAYDQRGDFDYDEQADGEDYINIDEGENANPEDDYFDEEDDADDFAKKMGVMYS
ncbi:zinc finger CCCH domain-containing protein 17-like [Apium graveolens]|uniref:zinc finger CCCH domain-containing protein 17-like n=1 Tax=Apium graveolens TaxID=4045 RepID=UPI003D7BC007